MFWCQDYILLLLCVLLYIFVVSLNNLPKESLDGHHWFEN